MGHSTLDPAYESSLAVIGLAGRFPGAPDLGVFWRNLRDGVCSVTVLSDQELRAAGVSPEQLANPDYVKAAVRLEDFDLFDPAFFGFSPREAEVTDPQQRLFLECAWEAVESAGYSPRILGGPVGVWAGASESTYLQGLQDHPELLRSVGHLRVSLGNSRDHLPTWVSYKLNLKGPSINVQTACSTSLVAVHLACQSLLNGECEVALAGGASVDVRRPRGYLYQDGGILSPDGYCRAFDAAARGTVSGSGVGVVVLKRLEDARAAGDPIRAVIRGSAINNDGSLKLGYTAPSLEGQARAISEALALAEVDAESLDYVEAHGTGTTFGDPIEIQALTEAFRSKVSASGYCAVGSVKSNIGHLDAAAGIAGLIKTVLALEHGEIPASLHFESPNPEIDFASSPFFVNARLREWRRNGSPRRAGVSSFGMGGTNAHVILEEAPPVEPASDSRPWQLLVLSARSEAALETSTGRLIRHLRRDDGLSLADVAYTLQRGRERFEHRRACVCRDLEDAVAALSPDSGRCLNGAGSKEPRPAAFLFPGQGAQSVGMGEELYAHEEEFRRQVDRCAEILAPDLGVDLRRTLFPQPSEAEEAAERMRRTAFAQPALFTVEYALARLWMSWGVTPDAMIGHSLGEYVAACLAGVFTLEGALRLIVERGRLIQELPAGAMLAVPLGEDELSPLCTGELSLAAVNARERCMVSGPPSAIDELARRLEDRKVATRRLPVAHAFHSAQVDPVLETFSSAVAATERRSPRIPFVSNLTGRWLTVEEATDPAYWARHMRHTVRFDDGVAELLADPDRVLLEVGPGQVLSGLCVRHPSLAADQEVIASLASRRSEPGEVAAVHRALGRLWLSGVPVDWEGVHAGEKRRRAPLPTYPFERRRFSFEPLEEAIPQPGGEAGEITEDGTSAGPGGATPESSRAMATNTSKSEEALLENTVSPSRKEAILAVLEEIVVDLTGLPAGRIDTQVDFLEIGVDSLLLIQAVQALDDKLGVKVSFLQLLEDLSNIDRLADYLDEELPPDAMPGPLADVVGRTVAESRQASGGSETVEGSVAPGGGAAPGPVPSATFPEESVPAPAAGAGFAAPTPGPGTAAPGQPARGALEQIVLQQTEIMRRHLELLRATDGDSSGPALATLAASAVASPEAARSFDAKETGTVPDGEALSASTERPPAGSKLDLETFSPYRPLDRQRRGLTERQQKHLDTLVARYEARTWKSKQHIQTYRPVLADGRMTARFRRVFKELVYPVVGDRSRGSRLWDIDGNEYVDLAMGFGLHHFGHSPDFIRRAQAERFERGLELGPHSNLAGRAAELICELSGQDRATFCNSGTEAVMCSLRLARTFTRRQKVVIFAGAYHGWSDCTLARPRLVDGELISQPEAPGVSAKAVQDVLVLPWDTPEALATIREHLHELAAVLVEPVQSRRPDVQPREFLHEIRRMTAEAGVPLIFDEMVTGFRILPGGAQSWFGIEADLVIYGKVLGAGLALGVVAGKSDLMDLLDGGRWRYGDDSYPPQDKTVFSGAYFKHPLTMATAVAILERIREKGEAPYRELNRRTQRLVDALSPWVEERGLPVAVANCGPLFRFLFPISLQWSQLFYYHLLDRGIHVSSEVGNCFLSFAHTEAEVDYVVEAVRDSFLEMQEGEFLPAPAEGREVVRRPLPSQPPRSADAEPPPVRPTTFTAMPDKPLPALDGGEPASRPAPGEEKVRFSLYYFGTYDAAFRDGKYDLLLEGAKFADRHGFSAVWIPERHFDVLGGFSPNPSVVAAALARETRHVSLRAGSVVLPIHHPIRVAEEWAVVDNLSKGRVGIALASGWRPDDFVFFPEAFEGRHERLREGLEVIRRLWRGDEVEVPCGAGQTRRVQLFPMPMQERLPVWLTGSRPETYRLAGKLGTGVLTNLQEDSLEELAAKVAEYRRSLAEHHGSDARGTVTVLLHTFLGDDLDAVREEARQPFYDYLRCHLNLQSNRLNRQGRAIDVSKISPENEEYLLARSYDRWGRDGSLIGTLDSCSAVVDGLIEAGVDEISCMIDFGVDPALALERLPLLDELRRRYVVSPEEPAVQEAGDPPVLAEPAEKGFPLTEGQHELWVTAQMCEELSRAYNEASVFHFRGPFDREAMSEALREVVRRHQALRTTFSADGRLQRVGAAPVPEVPFEDLSVYTPEERESRMAEIFRGEVEPAFDLVYGPLLRARILRVAEDEHLLTFTAHHLIIDGWSQGVVLEDLQAFYSAFRRGEAAGLPEPMRFSGYAEKLRNRLEDMPSLARSEAYWRELLEDAPDPLELPGDRPRPRLETFDNVRLSRRIGRTAYRELKKFCRAKRSTLFMVLLAGYNALLHRLTGLRDIVTGFALASQPSSGDLGVVGYCIHLIPLRSRLPEPTSFDDYLAVIKQQVSNAEKHQSYPLGRLLEQVRQAGDLAAGALGLTPLFKTSLSLDREGTVTGFKGLVCEISKIPPVSAKLDLYLNPVELAGDLLLECDFKSDLFDGTTIRRWLGHFQALLAGCATHPGSSLWSLDLLSPAERQQLAVEWNATEAGYPASATIHELFDAWAARQPDTVAAVEDRERGLSFGELRRRSDGLAEVLQSRGVGPDVVVGICMESSLAMVLSTLGILKAGGAYLPLDPVLPRERLRTILEDSGVMLLLVSGAGPRPEISSAGLEIVDVETLLCSAGEPTRTDRSPGEARPDSLAYVIYTSGSTGKPKGALLAHRGLCNLIRAQGERFGFGPDRSVLQFSSASFDASVLEVVVSLACGATVCLAEREERLPGPALRRLVRDYRCYWMVLPPSVLAALEKDDIPCLRSLAVAGEAFPAELAERWAPGRRLLNAYGPTESTIWVTAKRYAGSGKPSIGRPIENVRVYVLGPQAQATPVGLAGELCLGGGGLARGYVGSAGLTAERFIPEPFSGRPGERMYRTGDLVRWLRDGELDFLGRVDRQVKIRGFRIELQEVEHALAAAPGVSSAVVEVRDTGPGRQLIAFIVPQPGSAPGASELRKFAARRLPDYMIPGIFVELEALPLTPSGKVDRCALPAVEASRDRLGEDFVPPRGGAEETLASIWARALSLENVGRHDNFFELGGDSILAIQIVSEARRAGFEIRPRQLFSHQTIAELAAVTRPDSEPVAPPVPEASPETDWEAGRRDFHWSQDDLDDIAAALSRASDGDPSMEREVEP